MQKATKVLIVGAGPTGLMMAGQLAIRNIPFRIIDKNEDHTTQSRALVIHARSLEIFNQMGIASYPLSMGVKAMAVNLIVNGKRVFHLDVENIGGNLTAFPFLFMLEQSKTESILNNYIKRFGNSVERKTELIDFSQNEKIITAVLRNDNGKEETIHTDWIIGADGAHSTVRNKLNIPFEGKTYEQSLFVLDCEASVDFPKDEMSIVFTKKAFTGFFPLTNGRYRVLGTIAEKLEGKNEITFEDVSNDFFERTRMNVRLSNPHWISMYHSHHRVVSTFRKGRCFLTGDAAHIHSPIGAQGMNTGLQDAYNLAWKLALVIQGKAKEDLLNTYHEERSIIARNLVKTTDRAFNYVNTQNFLLKNFRMYLMPYILKVLIPVVQKQKFIRKFMFKTVSQIGIHYRKSKLSKEDIKSSFPQNAPKPGDRVPYLSTTEYVLGTEDFISGTKFHLIVFPGATVKEDVQQSIHNSIKKYEDLIELKEILKNDKTKKLYQLFGIKNQGYYIIRPDSYVGFRSGILNAQSIFDYFNKL